nr:hypothetical protein [Providencia rettgeri]
MIGSFILPSVGIIIGGGIGGTTGKVFGKQINNLAGQGFIKPKDNTRKQINVTLRLTYGYIKKKSLLGLFMNFKSIA